MRCDAMRCNAMLCSAMLQEHFSELAAVFVRYCRGDRVVEQKERHVT